MRNFIKTLTPAKVKEVMELLGDITPEERAEALLSFQISNPDFQPS